jgi:hypothetical protein
MFYKNSSFVAICAFVVIMSSLFAVTYLITPNTKYFDETATFVSTITRDELIDDLGYLPMLPYHRLLNTVKSFDTCIDEDLLNVNSLKIKISSFSGLEGTVQFTPTVTLVNPSMTTTAHRESLLLFGKPVEVYKGTKSLCSYTDCPIVVGVPTTISDLMDDFIPFGKYEVKVEVFDETGKKVSCIEMDNLQA